MASLISAAYSRAFDLVRVASLLEERRPAIEAHTGYTAEEVTHAKRLGERLVRAAGLKEQRPAASPEDARIRDQAYVLLARAYDETRRAVAFVRWRDGDADAIAPSLFAARRRQRDTGGADAATSVDAPLPVVPAAPAIPTPPTPPAIPAAPAIPAVVVAAE